MRKKPISEETKEKIRNTLTGRKLTEEHKKNISLGGMGRVFSESSREKLRKANIGKKHSEETKLKISKSRRGIANPREAYLRAREKTSGSKHYNWKGGLTPVVLAIRRSFKNREWRITIFERDNYTCQYCGVRGGWKEAHHIKPFSLIMKENKIKTLEDGLKCNELWNIDNGITLCKDCHSVTKKIKKDNYGI